MSILTLHRRGYTFKQYVGYQGLAFVEGGKCGPATLRYDASATSRGESGGRRSTLSESIMATMCCSDDGLAISEFLEGLVDKTGCLTPRRTSFD